MERAIDSCLNQSFTGTYEIIVVDDNGKGSTEQIVTETLVKKYSNQHTNYFALEKNSGACVARNEGIKVALGEFIFFLDDDDEFLSEKIKIQTEFLDSNTIYAGCLSSFRRMSDNGIEIIAESNFPNTGDFKNFVLNGNFFTPMLCIRRSSLKKVGGFINIPRFQDRYLMLRCLQHNFRFADLKEELYIMYEHSGERVTHKSVQKSIESLDIIKNYIDLVKQNFTPVEYEQYLLKDNRMRATIYYVGRNRWSSFFNWFKVFAGTKSKNDFAMMLKTLVK